MKRYIITIVNLETNCIYNLIRDDSDIEKTIQKELGGWNNLRNTSTSNKNINDINYQQCETTKNNKYMYSILSHLI